MTNEEKQALIERCKTVSSWREKYGDFANVMLPAIEAKEIAQIALAALTAQPVKLEPIIQIGYTQDEITCMCNVRNDDIKAIRASGYEVQE